MNAAKGLAVVEAYRGAGMPGVNKAQIAPRAISDLLDDLAVEVDLTMRRRGLRMSDLERSPFDYSPTQVKKISAWLRGTHTQMHPRAVSALTLAEKLGIPVAIRVGDEARAA